MQDTQGELERARAKILALVADLEGDLAAIAESTADGPDDEHDAEGSTVGYERARVSALLDRASRAATELSAGLERLKAGKFGRCEQCGGEIDPSRLEALPAARMCIACAAGQ
ncbi:MAG: TraR/DksA C4-type zinc finger protein [Actinomycetota bacterium]|nr:TraR/DksA C4-type zinc finger protein [Actinomycetota bacterium]